MCPVAAPPPGAPLTRKKQSNRDERHVDATPSAPGQTTAALEAAAGCLRTHHRSPGRPGGLGHPVAPQAPSPNRAPRVALPTATTEPTPTSLTTSMTTEPTTAPSPPTSSPDTKPSAGSRPITTAG